MPRISYGAFSFSLGGNAMEVIKRASLVDGTTTYTYTYSATEADFLMLIIFPELLPGGIE